MHFLPTLSLMMSDGYKTLLINLFLDEMFTQKGRTKGITERLKHSERLKNPQSVTPGKKLIYQNYYFENKFVLSCTCQMRIQNSKCRKSTILGLVRTNEMKLAFYSEYFGANLR